MHAAAIIITVNVDTFQGWAATGAFLVTRRIAIA
jgi:hypothetical protein